MKCWNNFYSFPIEDGVVEISLGGIIKHQLRIECSMYRYYNTEIRCISRNSIFYVDYPIKDKPIINFSPCPINHVNLLYFKSYIHKVLDNICLE
jgi:hypothetical protein